MLKIKKDFTWFENNPGLIYADSAATSLKPKSVVNTVIDYYDFQCTNPHNSDSEFSNIAKLKMNECRKILAEFIGANEEEIIFTSGATESLSLIAQSVQDFINPDDEIVLTKIEHASNLLPWYKLRAEKKAIIKFVPVKNLLMGPADFVKLLTPKTKIVSFAAGSNLIGITFDYIEITKAIKKYNNKILVCVDVAQAISHKKISVAKSGADFMAFSAHKMFGPTGIGACYIKENLQSKLKPLRYGGGMNFSISTNIFCYLDNKFKFEGGTPNCAGIYGWIEAIKYLNKISYEAIELHEKEIFKYLIQELGDDKNLEIYNKTIPSGTLAFNYKGIFCQDFASYLGNNNIVVRAGLSCAKLMNDVIGTDGIIRASFYVYNDLDDLKTFVKLIKDFKKEDILNDLIW